MQPRSFVRFAASLAIGLLLSFGTAGNARAAPPCNFSDVLFGMRAVDMGVRAGRPAHAPTAAITLSPTSLPYAYNGDTYAQAITASGGTAPYIYAITAGSPPPGIALAPDGMLSGTPFQDGTFAFTVTATDSAGASGSLAYTLEVGTVTTIVVSPASVPIATRNTPYSVQFTASGGLPPYVFDCIGDLPDGLVMNADGQLAGTPLQVGSFGFTIIATDATFEFSGSRSYTLTVQEASIELVPTSLGGGTVGVAYAEDIDASGGSPPYFFFLDGGTLPPGLLLDDSTGAISGIPTTAGNFSFTVGAMDALERQGSRAYGVTIAAPTILLDPPVVPDATVGTAYEQPLSASGGTAPYTFAVTAGVLPAGMAMDGDGIIDGTPEEAGSFDFTVTATDAFGQTGEQAYALTVLAPVIVIAPSVAPDATVGVAYDVTFSATGGNGPYTFAVTEGALPPGLFLASDGVLNGEPTMAGDFAFTVTATDNFNQTGEQAYAVTVANATITLSPTTLPAGTVGTAYEQPLVASGGTGPYSFAVTAGSLPAGMAMDGDGIIDGTPESAGDFGFTVTATDAFGQTGEQAYALAIMAPVIVLTPGEVPDGIVGVDYAVQFAASGGNGPYTFAVAAGVLPPGLSLASDGVLNGAPTAGGTYGFTVSATDNFNQTGAQAYAITVENATITLTPTALPAGTVGTAYAQPLDATGGTGPYSFAVTSGSLPTGMGMDADGIIDGTPESAGDFAFTVAATDAFGQVGERAYTLVIDAPTIVLAPGALPDASVDAPYTLTFTATGGTAPYAFTVGEGTLPPGLVLGVDGTLAGTPTTDGGFAFTVVATDAFEQSGSANYTLAVSAPELPDPTVDPEVIGLLVSQVNTVRTFVTTQVMNVHERMETLHDGSEPGWGFWIAGSFRTGDRDGNDNVRPLDFETSGVTGGSDYRLNNSFAFGGGLGFARDRTAIGDDGSRTDGDAPSGVSYMSWHPEDLPFFLDGMGGYQRIDFDVRRFSAAGGTIFEGRRHGRQEFTSWSSGYEYSTDTFLFSPYARVDAAEARLDGFVELGDNPYALQYGPQDIDLRTTTLGFRMKFRKTVAWGELEPRVRIEYQRDFHDESGIAISYANQPSSPVFFTAPTGLDRNRVIVELGTLLRTNWYGLLFRVDYLGVFGGYNDDEHMLRFSMQED